MFVKSRVKILPRSDLRVVDKRALLHSHYWKGGYGGCSKLTHIVKVLWICSQIFQVCLFNLFVWSICDKASFCGFAIHEVILQIVDKRSVLHSHYQKGKLIQNCNLGSPFTSEFLKVTILFQSCQFWTRSEKPVFLKIQMTYLRNSESADTYINTSKMSEYSFLNV